MIIAVTGRIGSGKTTVAGIAAKRLNYLLIDADQIGHELLEKPAVRQRVVQQFGKGMLSKGKVSRKRLARIVFSQPARLRQLNRIMHPLITNEIIRKSSGRQAVVDAALYNELKLDKLSDFTILVKAPDALIQKRLRGRFTKKQVANIIRAHKIRAPGSYAINNDGTMPELRKKVAAALKKLK